MKRPHILGALLALVVIAAGAWLLLRGDGKKKAQTTTAGAVVDAGATFTNTGASTSNDNNGPQRGDVPILIDDEPIGTLVLEGQVIDQELAGVGGATVVISSNPPRTVKTEADGSFAFDKLVGRAYEIEARADQGVAGPITSRLTA